MKAEDVKHLLWRVSATAGEWRRTMFGTATDPRTELAKNAVIHLPSDCLSTGIASVEKASSLRAAASDSVFRAP
ncbi:MAG: hypothetical protein QOF01_4819 [Thermomicrobiales bacterium]|nr:hypothetical protein [Thermomicrobiales bacterium]